MRIGSRAVASSMEDYFQADREWWHLPFQLRRETTAPTRPSEFKPLSGGSCRSVYLHEPSEVVYKFPSYLQHGYTNSTEYTHARALRNQSDKGWIGRVYIPLTSGYRVNGGLTLAMEYIDGEEPWGESRKAAAARRELFALGFSDMHEGNYRLLPRARVAPIDMGSPRMRQHKTVMLMADSRVLSGTAYDSKVFAIRERHYLMQRLERPCDCAVCAVH